MTIYTNEVMQAIIEHSGESDRWIGLKKNELEDGKYHLCCLSQYIKLKAKLYKVMSKTLFDL